MPPPELFSKTDCRMKSNEVRRGLAGFLVSAPLLAVRILGPGRGVTCLSKSLSWNENLVQLKNEVSDFI